MKNILIFLILPISIYAFIGDIQVPKWQHLSIGASGQLKCNGKPFPAKIELYDYFNTWFPKLLNTTYPTRKGTFEIIGTREKVEPIHPYVYITHKCGKIRKNCKIQFYKEIPWEGNLYQGKAVGHFFNLGEIELRKHQKDQEKICSGDRLI